VRITSGLIAGLTGACFLMGAMDADANEVGAMAQVQRTVYGVPPQGSQSVKREGDTVLFKEALETVANSGALIRFIDDSTLALGEKSKVLIDEFVFDPGTAEGNALIRISVGTLRLITGDMPKGKTVIKTPTATLVLRGTDVTVHVRPDGTTDATVRDGSVDARNDVTSEDSNIGTGDALTLGAAGNSAFSGTDGPTGGSGGGGGGFGLPEQRRGGGSVGGGETTDPEGGGAGPGPAN
jgi:hypothetical protein